MLPQELTLHGIINIAKVALVGTWIFIAILLFIAGIYVCTGGHWWSKLEALIFKQINRLDGALYWIFDQIMGKGENA